MLRAAIRTHSSGLREQIGRLLTSCGCRPADDRPAPDAIDFAVVECGCKPHDPGLEWAKKLRRLNNAAIIVILATDSSEELAIEALRLKAEEYFRFPWDLATLAGVVARCTGNCAGNEERDELRLESAIVGDSAIMQAVRESVARLSRTDSSVLITGETGTGKECVAQSIHEASRRKDRPFICVDCAAIPDTLLESELFGYERGAFTGAVAARQGKLRAANGGTLFFDEIGDMSLPAQSKILRAIETREIWPLGGSGRLPLDVRVIAATNRDLDGLMKEDRFRPDLYFRLNVGRIHLPPLRERLSDIPHLVRHFLPHFNHVFGRQVEGIGEQALRELMSYSWPGNVRELRNVLEVMFVNLPPRHVRLAALDGEVVARLGRAAGTPDERERIVSALVATEWNISRAARRLQWSRMTLYRKLAKYDVVRARELTEKPRKATA